MQKKISIQSGDSVSDTLLMVALTVASGALFLFRLGKGALIWDEAIYAEVSREMVANQKWLTLFWQHQFFFEKPPLSFWPRALLFEIFGANEFWARFESAIAGVGIVMITYLIARRLSGPATGIFAGVVLLTSRYFVSQMRAGSTDALLCLFIYAAIYFYIRLQDGGRVWFYLLCAAIGLGAMTKGPAIIVVVAAVGLDMLLKRNSARILHWWDYPLGFLLILAIVAPWHLWMIHLYGNNFMENYFGYHLLKRATQVIVGQVGGPFYYFRIIGINAFPWSLIAVAALARWIWRREWKYSPLWLLIAVTLALYSSVATKVPWYIIPVYPALAIVVGQLLFEVGRERRFVRYGIITGCAAAYLLAFILVVHHSTADADQMAYLAQLAGKSEQKSDLLFLHQQELPYLSSQNVVYYSNRTINLLNFPSEREEIDKALAENAQADAIVQNESMNKLVEMYNVHQIAHNDAGYFVVISRKF